MGCRHVRKIVFMTDFRRKHSGRIFSVNISEQKGAVKKPVNEIIVGKKGVIGDIHYGYSERHVSLISRERIDEFSSEIGTAIMPGEFAENITKEGLDLTTVKLADHFKAGNVELEVIQIGKPEAYHGDGNGVFRIIGKSVMLHEGLFCRVMTTGKIALGDIIEFIPNQDIN